MSEKLRAVIAYLIDVKKVSNMTPKKLQKMLYYCYAHASEKNWWKYLETRIRKSYEEV